MRFEKGESDEGEGGVLQREEDARLARERWQNKLHRAQAETRTCLEGTLSHNSRMVALGQEQPPFDPDWHSVQEFDDEAEDASVTVMSGQSPSAQGEGASREIARSIIEKYLRKGPDAPYKNENDRREHEKYQRKKNGDVWRARRDHQKRKAGL